MLFRSPQYCAIYFPTVINNYHCGEGANVQLIRDEDFQGRWHDFVFHARWSSDPAKGFSDMWVDGDQVLGFVGPTLTPGNSVYFKYGIYRWTDARPLTVWYDEVRRGSSRAQVDIRMMTAK